MHWNCVLPGSPCASNEPLAVATALHSFRSLVSVEEVRGSESTCAASTASAEDCEIKDSFSSRSRAMWSVDDLLARCSSDGSDLQLFSVALSNRARRGWIALVSSNAVWRRSICSLLPGPVLEPISSISSCLVILDLPHSRSLAACSLPVGAGLFLPAAFRCETEGPVALDVLCRCTLSSPVWTVGVGGGNTA